MQHSALLAGAAVLSRPAASEKRPLTVAAAIDGDMAAFKAATTRGQRLASWKQRLGDKAPAELDDDVIFYHLQMIAAEPAHL